MATYGKKLLDPSGNIILPKTRSSLVYCDDDNTVEDQLKDLYKNVNNLVKGTTVTNANRLLGRGVAINTAWWHLLSATGDPNLNSAIPYYAAVHDGAGMAITTTYLKLSGGTMTGDLYAIAGKNTAVRRSTVFDNAWNSQTVVFLFGIYA